MVSSTLEQSQLFVFVVLYFQFHFQASWNCPGGGYPRHPRHSVETLQRVWAAENLPPGHLPVHHRPSTTREKGKGLAYKSWKHQAHAFYLGLPFCWLESVWAHRFLLLDNYRCTSDRLSSCGTSCLQTTSTRTLSNGGESAWRTSCCVLHRIPYSPMIKSSSSSWQRSALTPHSGRIQVKSGCF